MPPLDLGVGNIQKRYPIALFDLRLFATFDIFIC